jgi:predicted dithiol-disulfide oxidoreductase (DUF899 family)
MTKDNASSFKDHAVVSQEQWLSARAALLTQEKEFSQLRDELNRKRRELPWEKVTKEYVFDGPNGKETLAGLFGNKNQLIVYHFMFAPEWDEGCPHCSFWADHFDGAGIHLPQRDTSFAVISRAPVQKIEAFKRRMGWRFKWVSSLNNDFNYDYHVSFTPQQIKNGTVIYNYSKVEMEDEDREGLSVFARDEGGVLYHTYSCYARGIDLINSTYNFLDLTPKGRDEDGPEGVQAWVRHHDKYEA